LSKSILIPTLQRSKREIYFDVKKKVLHNDSE
jgi:hypothetical protein